MANYNPDLEYLGIDYEYADDMVRRNVSRAAQAADNLIRGLLGFDAYVKLRHDSRCEELRHIYMADLYNNSGVSEKVSGSVRRSVQMLELQLQMEARQLREAAKEETGT